MHGKDEMVFTCGQENAKQHILFIPPLFAEMNKMRSTLVAVMRHLSNNGIASYLPDLPGCNESLVPFNLQNLSLWRDAMQNCVQQYNITHIFALRGGCLIDNIMIDKPHYRLNKVKGANIIKTLLRSKVIAQKEAGIETNIATLSDDAQKSGIELAGYHLSASLFDDMQNAVPLPIDEVTEYKVGDDIEGSNLWIRSEPEYDVKMTASIANSLITWCTS